MKNNLSSEKSFAEKELFGLKEALPPKKKREEDLGPRDFGDKIVIKSPSKYFLYCEGKTDKKYFSNLLEEHFDPTSRVELRAEIPNSKNNEGTNARQLVNQFVKKKSSLKFNEKYDKFFLIFDRDNNHFEPSREDNNLDYAILECKKHNVTPIFSNPCFEVWGICQFQEINDPDFPFESKKVKKLFSEIKQKKPSKENNLSFETKLSHAKKNAKTLYNCALAKKNKIHSEQSFPVTEVFLLVEELEKEFD